MYHYKSRLYSRTLGRFLQTDTIGYDGGINLYAYVNNDPVNEEDSTGACPICKLGVDFTIEVGIQYATEGKVDLGQAAIETAKGALNPLRTLQRAQKLSKILNKADRVAARVKKTEIHHVVPKGDRRAASARDHMRANGIDLKSEKSNKVAISGDKHDITKRDSYIREVDARVSAQQSPADIRNECCKISKELLDSSMDELEKRFPPK